MSDYTPKYKAHRDYEISVEEWESYSAEAKVAMYCNKAALNHETPYKRMRCLNAFTDWATDTVTKPYYLPNKGDESHKLSILFGCQEDLTSFILYFHNREI